MRFILCFYFAVLIFFFFNILTPIIKNLSKITIISNLKKSDLKKKKYFNSTIHLRGGGGTENLKKFFLFFNV